MCCPKGSTQCSRNRGPAYLGQTLKLEMKNCRARLRRQDLEITGSIGKLFPDRRQHNSTEIWFTSGVITTPLALTTHRSVTGLSTCLTDPNPLPLGTPQFRHVEPTGVRQSCTTVCEPAPVNFLRILAERARAIPI